MHDPLFAVQTINYQLKWINPATGEIIKAPFEGTTVAWLYNQDPE